MSSASTALFKEVGHCGNLSSISSFANSSDGVGHFELEEEDEDEDVDFNPFGIETPSPEPSSSLSSENEDLGDGVKKNMGSSSDFKDVNALPTLANVVPDCKGRDSENEDAEFVMQIRTCQEGASISPAQPKMWSIHDEGCRVSKDSIASKDNISSSGTGAVHVIKDSSGQTNNRKPIVDMQIDHGDGVEAEDAICRRTRARYSLANFSLDELEMFLQESDDDGDLQNVDDEEEYRKFLTAVLQGGDDEGMEMQENVNADDEENDADFEIEIEEALESDTNERARVTNQKGMYEGAGHGPETRQKKRQKASVKKKNNLLGHAKIPLRPLLPFVSNAQMIQPGEWQRPLAEGILPFTSSASQVALINGFTAHQIGQLHCLIHEHIQLLVQVFSLCVVDPSRQEIANEVQNLLLEMCHKREEVLASRKDSYPDFCLRPPYIQPSVSCALPKLHQTQEIVDPSCLSSCSFHLSEETEKNYPRISASSEARNNGNIHASNVDLLRTSEKSVWVPVISGPVRSVLDVAPLSLVSKYVADISTAVQEYKQCWVEAVRGIHFEREPLFPLPSFASVDAPHSNILRGAATTGVNAVKSSFPGHQQPKRTMAAALVESTKKQSVALVPKNIAELAQRFFPLFNLALFPHKPPPISVTNRVLFTDSEDELLALGLMEYNTDWKAIQQRFLPCKSKHQIFVRQKNRCSSKAPENPIKAIRRMKTSPLTLDEIARIQEGLKLFNHDWTSVWTFLVPHRDPSLLPRQWRIALGIQKSYKQDQDTKAKRRIYESRRKKSKAASTSSQIVSEKEDCLVDNLDGRINSVDDTLDDEDEAYVHEAFLADWRPGNSTLMSSELPFSSISKNDLQFGGIISDSEESLQRNSCMNEFVGGSKFSRDPQHVSHFSHPRYNTCHTVPSSQLASDWIPKPPVNLRPYRSRRSNAVLTVKLAPDLPPVNLPSSVRVISQSAFKSYNSGLPNSQVGGNGTVDLASKLPHVIKSGNTHSVNTGKKRNLPCGNRTDNACPQVPRSPTDQHVTEENGAESDLQMHPLLFQAPEYGCSLYYPMNYSATSASSLFPGNLFQVDLNCFMKPQPAGSIVGTPASLGIIDFHPLLQRTDNVSSGLATVSSAVHLFGDPEQFQGNCAQFSNPSGFVTNTSQVKNGVVANTAPSSPFEKANALDLDINLSSVTSKEKNIGNRDRTGGNHNGSVHGKRASNKSNVIDAHEMLTSNSIERCTVDNSLPEIVMEQEELSDSDEEIGEHVEFEREEMADSEGEGLDSEQLADVQNKDTEIAVAEEEDIITNEDHDGQSRKPGICSPRKKVRVTKGNTRSRKSGSMEKGKITNSKQLSSDSGTPPAASSCSKPKREYRNRAKTSKSPSNALESSPGRSNKRRLKEEAKLQHTEIQQPLTSAPYETLNSKRKPRRPTCKTNSTSVNMGNS